MTLLVGMVPASTVHRAQWVLKLCCASSLVVHCFAWGVVWHPTHAVLYTDSRHLVI